MTTLADNSEADKTCQALEARREELDATDETGVRKIKERSYADKEYTALKECLRIHDDNLRQEKPLLSFDSELGDVQGLTFGMNRKQVEEGLGGNWRSDGCTQFFSAQNAGIARI